MRSIFTLLTPLCAAAQAALAAPQLSTVWSVDDVAAQFVRGLGVDAAGAAYQIVGDARELRAVDANGALLWVAPLPVGMVGNDLAVLAGGEIVVVGGEPHSPSSIPGGLGQQDALVARFDSNGALLGAHRIGADQRDEARCVAADGVGGYVVGGWTTGPNFGGPGLPMGTGGPSFLARYDAAGVEQWVARIENSFSAFTLYDADFAPNGDVVAAGQNLQPGAFDSDRLRVRADGATGAVTWRTGANGIYYTVEAQGDGSLLWGGRGYSTSTTGFLRLEPPTGGTGGWTVHVPDGFTADSRVNSAISDGAGGYYASVVDGSPTNVGNPIFVGLVRYDANGAETWRIAEPTPLFSRFDQPALARGPLGDVRVGARWLDQTGPTSVSKARVARLSLGEIGAATCAAQPNSVGAGATLRGTGSDELSADGLTLYASDLPAAATVLFLVSDAPAFVPQPGGSQGDLCLGGAIGRYVGAGQLGPSSSAGLAHFAVEWATLPGPTGARSAAIGETWQFQAWYRDANPGPTSNFTSGLSVTVR